MPIAVQCSSCQGRFRAPDEAAGKRVKCPKCSTIFLVPTTEQRQPAQSGLATTPSPSSLAQDATSGLAEKWSLAAANAKSCADQVKRVADIFKRLAVDAVENISIHMTQRCAECAQQAASLAQAASQTTGANMAKLAAESADAAEGAALYAEFLIYDFDEAMKQEPAAEKTGGAALFGDPVRRWQDLQQVASELFELCITTEKAAGCKVTRGSVFPGGGNSRMLNGDTMLMFIPVVGDNLGVEHKYMFIREARGQLASEAGSKQGFILFENVLDRIVGQIGAFHAEQQLHAKDRCFIATAACSSAQAPELQVLRRFRDTVLNASAVGRTFIKLYKRCSPRVAHWIERRPWARGIVRTLLVHPLASILKRHLAVPAQERRTTMCEQLAEVEADSRHARDGLRDGSRPDGLEAIPINSPASTWRR